MVFVFVFFCPPPSVTTTVNYSTGTAAPRCPDPARGSERPAGVRTPCCIHTVSSRLQLSTRDWHHTTTTRHEFCPVSYAYTNPSGARDQFTRHATCTSLAPVSSRLVSSGHVHEHRSCLVTSRHVHEHGSYLVQQLQQLTTVGPAATSDVERRRLREEEGIDPIGVYRWLLM